MLRDRKYSSFMFLIYICAFICLIPSRSVFGEGTPAYSYTLSDVSINKPEGIIIATPEDNYSTPGKNVSILGACNPDYPLYVDGRLIPTTKSGFFIAYISLQKGNNEIHFSNGESTAVLHIYSGKYLNGSSQGGSSGKAVYEALPQGSCGIVTSEYTMRRASITASSPELIPLSGGTELELLGTMGSFFQIFDGTFVSKSAIKQLDSPLPVNRVSLVRLTDDTEHNSICLTLNQTVNVPVDITLTDSSTVKVILHNTDYVPRVLYSQNDTVKKVYVHSDNSSQTVEMSIKLWPGAAVTGYDIKCTSSASGIKKTVISFKKQPHPVSPDSLKGTLVLLDPGHGSDQPGALGPLGNFGPAEKDCNLNIAIYSARYLEDMGATVFVTRTTDVFLTLNERVSLIRNLKPDISVSVHGNSLAYETDFASTHGYTTYYTYNEFNNAPQIINRSIIKSLGFSFREVKQKSLSLTRLTACPAVLLETLFLSFPEDYELLIDPAYEERFGQSIALAIAEYLHSNAVYNQRKSPIVHLAAEEKILN